MKVLFDTSVLVSALIVSHPRHAACALRLNQAKSQEVQGLVSTHSLAETYSVITRLPLRPRVSPAIAQRQITVNLQQLEAISLTVADYQAAIAQMVALNLPGGGIFDALIAQAALKAKADILLTLNPDPFTRLGSAIANLVQVPE